MIHIREKNVEPKNSCIQWEKADSDTAKRLTAALNTHKIARVVINIIIIFVTAFMLMIIINCVIQASKDPSEALALYMIGGLPACVILSAWMYKYLKMRPYMYPEKQNDIWIFRTKCFRVAQSGTPYTSRPRGYFAFFNSKAGQISMQISYNEYNSNPAGKEYIFYKFNNRTGNRWAAIPAKTLDKFY